MGVILPDRLSTAADLAACVCVCRECLCACVGGGDLPHHSLPCM